MEISESQVRAFLDRVYPQGLKPCDACGHPHWTYDNRVYELREFSGGGLVIGGSQKIIPALALTCTNCGNTKLINALVAGLMPKG